MFAELKIKLAVSLFGLLGMVTLVDAIDVTVRILSGIVAIVIGVYAVGNYRDKKKINRVDLEIKNQELYRLMDETKRRDAASKNQTKLFN